MNTNHLKKFAQEARRKLLEQVGAKLSFVLTTDSAELREKTEQLKQLRQELGRTTKEQLIEKVAYTWFNRLMALRFMDINDYQPLGIRIITPKDGYTTSELLDEAKRGNIPDEIKVKRQKIYDLLDSRIPSKNPQNEAFKELLIAACNHLHVTFPFLFEKINDYTELLLPDDLTSDFSIVKDVRDGMPIDDCKKVEIIGWLYQFYISEKKDEVFASKSKVRKEDIPAATQLFTPRWIVEYMVQNTLGKLWMQNRHKSRLREHMPYFIKSASIDVEDYLKINSPEELKILDPASGSGHILVYAFDLLCKIYEEEGYSTSEIPQFIINNNLYGFEIDERAAQLSALALMMKAREYNRRAFQKELRPRILCYQDLNVSKDEIQDLASSIRIKISNELIHDLLVMQQATNFGSLIKPHSQSSEIEHFLEKNIHYLPNADVFQHINAEAVINSLKQLKLLANKFHCVVANPPYMGSGNMNNSLSDFVKSIYPDSKSDLMACFMESGLEMVQDKGFVGMINQQSWMFIGSYEALRRKLIENSFIDTMLHLGARTFPEIGGEVVQNTAFTFWKKVFVADGVYLRLIDYDKSGLKESKTIEAINNRDRNWIYSANQNNFKKIPSSPIGYWLGDKVFEIFANEDTVSSISEGRIGLATGRNDKYLRNWNEVGIGSIGFKLDRSSAKTSGLKWFPYNKGGTFRRWYGNRQFVINWYNDGFELQTILSPDGKRIWAHNFNLDYIFRKHIGWSDITTSGLSFRFYDEGFLFDSSGTSAFVKDEKFFTLLLGLLNAKFVTYISEVLNPTFHFTPGDYNNIPFIDDAENLYIECIEKCIDISKADWDTREQSWDFKHNELLRLRDNEDLLVEEAIDHYKQFWQLKFFQLHRLEEDINRQINELYGTTNELTPCVQLNEVSIIQNEIDKGRLTELNKRIARETNTYYVKNYNELRLPFIDKELIMQFMSYSVGCMFGRYSLDKEGLVIANQGETLQDYLQKIGKSVNEYSFLPDEDNIIPILDDEWFEDDIVEKFNRFLKVSFGEKNFNKNLTYIEEQIGKDIRKYLIKDFYSDHIKRYNKRPIYWMFSSPNGSFNVLIYMHRYTPDTVSNILNKYLKEFIGKLNTRKEHLEHVQVTGSASDKTKAIKEIDNIEKMQAELHEYERDVLYPLATERIEIDLDDGVLVNYNKFGKAVKEVNGLNDPATKKKVKQFDWIDTSLIK